MHELLETEQARALVENAEERGFVEAAELEAFALEHDLADDEVEQFQRELEAIGLEFGPRAAAEAAESGARAGAASRSERRRGVGRQPAALPRRRRPAQAADRGPRRSSLAKAIERGDARREAPHDRVEPPPGRLDREGLPRPRRPVPRPDPGGHARPQPRGREVRLAPRLQVLDLRDLVDPPVGAARRREPRAHDPRARARRRAPAEARRAPRAGSRSSSAARRRSRSSPRRPACRSSTSTRRSAPRRRRSR